MRGRLLKCSAEQVRRATDDQWRGADLIKVIKKELLDDLKVGRRRGYVNVQPEGPPDDQDESRDQPGDETTGNIGGGMSAPRSETPAQPPETEVGPEEVPVPASSTGNSSSSTSSSSSSRTEPEPQGQVSVPGSVTERDLADPDDESLLDSVIRISSSAAADRAHEPGAHPLPAEKRQKTELPPSTTPKRDASTLPDRPQDKRASTGSAHPWFDVPALPAPSLYVQTGRLEDDTVGNNFAALVNVDGKQHCSEEILGETLFTIGEAVSAFDHEVGKMFIVKRQDPDGIEFWKLSDADKEKFKAARVKEIETLIEKGALKKLSVKESEEFEKLHGAENILDSGFVEKWKRTDDDVIAKSRHVIKGWQDPMILQIERTAPAPTAEDEAAIFQVVASMGWDGYVGDVKNAFGQSSPSNRKTPIACRQPSEGIPGMKPGELLQCITECYGLVSGPAWWRASLVGWLEEAGYMRHPLAPCLMILPCKEEDKSRDKMTDGVMSIRTDDLFEGGEPRHRALIDKMRKRFEFGKYKRLLDDASGTMLNGRRVLQYDDKVFVLT